jgi:hypothetical protein
VNNKVVCGIFASALLASAPSAAFGQTQKQLPQRFMGKWCDTGNEGDSFSIYFKPINKAEDCKTKQVLELTTDFLNLYNDDAETNCFLVNWDSVNPGKVQGQFICGTHNYKAKRNYTTQEVYELAFQRDETLRLRDMKRADQK